MIHAGWLKSFSIITHRPGWHRRQLRNGIGEPQYANHLLPFGHQQRLMVAQDELMNAFVEGGIRFDHLLSLGVAMNVLTWICAAFSQI
jgi:hypothetical protein